MKILVVSDSHHCLSYLYDAVEKEMPHRVFHLGDHITDAQDLGYAFDDLDLQYVPGNCDYAPQASASLLTEVGGKRFFLTHGHLFGVKSGLTGLRLEAQRLGAEVVLFGHTHVPYCRLTDGVWYLNPGSCSAMGRSYGLVTIENGQIRCSLHKLD